MGWKTYAEWSALFVGISLAVRFLFSLIGIVPDQRPRLKDHRTRVAILVVWVIAFFGTEWLLHVIEGPNRTAFFGILELAAAILFFGALFLTDHLLTQRSNRLERGDHG